MNISLRSKHEVLPLGTSITFHHRAGVARYHRAWRPLDDRSDSPPMGWVIHEGAYKRESIPTGMGESTSEFHHIGPAAEYVVVEPPKPPFNTHSTSYRLVDMFFNWPQAKFYKYWHRDYPSVKPTEYNKTVFVWPSNGTGVIMGMIRKSIGTSRRSYGRGEDYEQGYHDSDMYVDLYVVKQRYEGTEYILCPLWAVRSRDGATA